MNQPPTDAAAALPPWTMGWPWKRGTVRWLLLSDETVLYSDAGTTSQIGVLPKDTEVQYNRGKQIAGLAFYEVMLQDGRIGNILAVAPHRELPLRVVSGDKALVYPSAAVTGGAKELPRGSGVLEMETRQSDGASWTKVRIHTGEEGYVLTSELLADAAIQKMRDPVEKGRQNIQTGLGLIVVSVLVFIFAVMTHTAISGAAIIGLIGGLGFLLYGAIKVGFTK